MKFEKKTGPGILEEKSFKDVDRRRKDGRRTASAHNSAGELKW